jgi:hypothetical protein
MTREELAARKAQRLKDKIAKDQEKQKEKLAADKRVLSQAEAVYREEQRHARNKRRYRLGTLADDAGLAVWDEPTLQGLFERLARLRELPDPVRVLDGLMSAPETLALTAAAAGPSLLASSGASDASDVSTRGGGGCAAVPAKNGAIGVSR